MRKVLDHDANTGISHVFNYDEDTDQVEITAEQDVSRIVELNKKQFNDSPTRFGEWDKVATIPMVILVDLKKRGILDDANEFKKWLNEPDNRYFRTRSGTI